MKRYTSYKNSKVEWIGEIPSHWEISKLKLLSELTTGNTPPKKDDDNYEGGIYPWVKPDELIGLNPTNDTKEKLTKKGKSLSRVIPPYSVLVNCIGDIGKIGYSEQEVSTNQQITSIIFDDTIEKRYGLFHSYIMKDEFRRNSECVVVPILNNQKQGDCFLVIPPLPEQKKIVSFLDDKTSKIDRLIQSKKRKIELLKEKRTSLINEVVTKGLNPNVEMKDSGVEWIGEIPSHWEVNKLKYISEVLPSNVDKNIHQEEHQIRLCNYTDVYYNEFITSDLDFSKGSCDDRELEKFLLQIGDVIITKDSESPDDIGIPTFVKNKFDDLVCGYHLTLIRSHSIEGKYLFRFIQSENTRNYFEVNSSGITRYGLGKSSIENLEVPIPPKSEQNQISEFIDDETETIDQTITLEKQKIDLLKEYKQSLISEVVTGKVNVQEEVFV